MNFRQFLRTITAALSNNAPELLTGFGIGSMISATVLAVEATPEAIRRIEKRKIKEGREELSFGEKVETAGSCYIPTALATVAGAGCVIGSNVLKNRQNAALATACSIAQTSLHEYQSKVIETIGEKKERQIKDEIVKDKIEKNPPPKEMVISEPDGVWKQNLCYDVTSGRYFHSDIESLKRAANKLNWQMNNGSETYISLNEWYIEVGMMPIYPLGEEFGWNTERGLIEVQTVEHRMPDGTYITGVTFEEPPDYGYNKF